MTFMFMSSMAVSDSILGALVMPLSVVPIIQNGQWNLGNDMCSAYFALTHIVCSVNACHILCMAVDKYIAVCRPLQYRLMKKLTAQVMICASWIFPISVTLLPKINGFDKMGLDLAEKWMEESHVCINVFNRDVFVSYLIISFYGPIIVTYFLYARIFTEICSFNNRSPQYHLENPSAPPNSKKNLTSVDVISITVLSEMTAGYVAEPDSRQSNYTIDSDTNLSKNKRTKVKNGEHTSTDSGESTIPRHISRHMRAIRTIGCIVAAFTVCWIPTSLYLVTIQYTGFEQPKWSVLLCFWFSFLNSTINPFLCCSMKSVRVKVRNLTGL
ncbi:unnamed protein product [Lymnaea stagnalis]|uniref:G-protein coupled receptors family 1 profile domain-containing protein n=1 Tax=Lymnaea stagnalis TaxID=6523 RepID=A0AAV2HPC1_LYMST